MIDVIIGGTNFAQSVFIISLAPSPKDIMTELDRSDRFQEWACIPTPKTVLYCVVHRARCSSSLLVRGPIERSDTERRDRGAARVMQNVSGLYETLYGYGKPAGKIRHGKADPARAKARPNEQKHTWHGKRIRRRYIVGQPRGVNILFKLVNMILGQGEIPDRRMQRMPLARSAS